MIERIEHNGYTIKIKQDDSPESPRTWDNLFSFCFSHRRYSMPWEFEVPERKLWLRLETRTEQVGDGMEFSFGGERPPRSWEEVSFAVAQRLQEKGDDIAYWSKVYMLDHSATRYALPDRLGGDPLGHYYMGMDSGCIGIAFVSRSKVLAEFGKDETDPETLEKLKANLKGEVETYDQWANGDVYGYEIEDDDGEFIDSCWGFYGLDYCRSAAKEACPEPALDGEPEI